MTEARAWSNSPWSHRSSFSFYSASSSSPGWGTASRRFGRRREGARYATTVGDSDSDGLPNYLDCASITDAALDKVIGMSLATSDVNITFSDLTGTPVADCDPATPLPAPSPSGSTNIDNGFGVQVEAEGTFNAIVPLLSSFLDGIDLTSSQNRSVFKGVVGE